MRIQTMVIVTCFTALAGAVTVSFPSPAAGQAPFCGDAPPVLVLTPDGSIPFTVVAGYGPDCLPAAGITVDVLVNPAADPLIAWAPGQDHPTATGITDADGEVTFYFAGAGCVDPARFDGTYVVTVLVEGFVVAEAYLTSPDVVNPEGLLPTDLGASLCEDGTSAVGLSDAVFHSRSIKDALVEPCSKLTGDPADPVDLDDAVALTPFIKSGATVDCAVAAGPGVRR